MNTPINLDTESYGEIGRLLKSARESMRMSTDQASRLLHIRVRYLDALESGKLAELPGLTYMRGYLQSYATFLGLDKDEILRRFEEVEAVLARKSFYFPQVFSKEKTPNHWMVWGGLVAALVIYVIWAMLLHPAPSDLSLVEKLPPPRPKVHISAEMVREVPCLSEPDVLYPPCTTIRLPEVNLLPTSYKFRGQYISIMDFGIMDFEEIEPEEEPESH